MFDPPKTRPLHRHAAATAPHSPLPCNYLKRSPFLPLEDALLDAAQHLLHDLRVALLEALAAGTALGHQLTQLAARERVPL